MIEPVSIEICKLLKEKRCFIGLENGKFITEEGSIILNPSYYKDRLEEIYLSKNCYLNPTIADVVMWLYKTHGIWIWVSCRQIENGLGTILFIPNGRHIPTKKVNGFEVDPILYTPKLSPTEAYLAAIEYCLNNVI